MVNSSSQLTAPNALPIDENTVWLDRQLSFHGGRVPDFEDLVLDDRPNQVNRTNFELVVL
jgi:hypothetical protein